MRRALFVGLLATLPFFAAELRAEDPPAAGKQSADASKKDPAVVSRVERAKQMVKELEEAVARVRGSQPVDAQLLLILTQALEQARALAKPAKPEELTAEEKQPIVDEAKKGDDLGKGPGASDWVDKQLGKAFEGADLNEEEQLKAKQVIGWTESKKQNDLKRKRDDDLEKAVGSKKARKIINNLNAMGPGRR
jgi:hypothetical protein